MLTGSQISVIEQNYNYNLLTPVNIVNESVGKTVKTALYDEKRVRPCLTRPRFWTVITAIRYCSSVTALRRISRVG